jgi:transcription antitermination factor NusG
MRIISGWFAIQVASRLEHSVLQHLDYKGYQTYLPTCQSKRKWSDRIKVLELPLFPNYVFCRSVAASAGLVLTIPGTIRLVGSNGRPSTIPDDEIEAIRRICASSRPAIPVPYMHAGQKVRIAAGPLAGIVGTLSRIRNDHRLIITLQPIMRSIAVEVGISDIVMAN